MNKTPDRIINEMIMSKKTCPFVLVEGWIDYDFFCNLIDEEYIKISNDGKNAKKSAIEIIEKLNKYKKNAKNPDKFAKVFAIAIVDTDFDKIKGKKYNIPNLFFTDTHDIETMIIKTKALEKVIRGNRNKKDNENFINSINEKKGIRQLLIENSIYMGYLRLYLINEEKYQCIGAFKNIDYENFINEKLLSIDLENLIDEVNSHILPKEQVYITEDYLMKMRNDEKYDVWHICNGHDMVKILFIGLYKNFGSKGFKNKREKDSLKDLEKDLILAYEGEYFETTKLFKSIKEWEKNNIPIKWIYN